MLRRLAIGATTVLALAALTAPALAIDDLAGNPVPNTSTASRTSQQVATGLGTLRAIPFSASPPPTLESPNSPEDDLAAALATMASASATGPEKEAARLRAIAILEGGAIPGAAYSGIGLLNDNPTPATGKVKTVPANGTVVVNVVRFGEHEISDTWQLKFDDTTQPFSIEYQVTELGGADGGELTPTPILHDGGTPIGGMHSIVADLTLDETNIGTNQGSRFTTARNLGPQPEHTRLATQHVTVRMPPPNRVSMILDPNLRTGHEALSSLRGFDAGSPGPAITISQLAAIAPERQLYDALTAPSPDLTAVGTQGKGLLSTMRVKSHLPPGVAADPAADVTIAFVNNEVYVSDINLQLRPSANLTVTVVNADGFAHTVDPIALKKLTPVFGATNWGEFDWERLAAPATLAAGATQQFTYAPSSNAFQLVIGDPTSGDQARIAITLDRGPIQESFRVPGPAFSMPLHQAPDADGNVWLTLAGAEKIARLTPADRLADSTYVEFPLPVPPGTPVGAALGVFEPLDIAVDGQGIIWATLPAANSIARLDPSLAQPGTSNGIEIIPLTDCPASECRLPPPPIVPGAPLSREPTQMSLRVGSDGLTEVWFTELFADKIGVLKRRVDGSYVQQHFTCACKVPSKTTGGVAAGTPLGIDVDDTGLVWFTAANKNTVGRITPGPDPFASSVIQTDHFKIPSFVTVNEPDIGGTFDTSIPHSVDVDSDGKVWFTEQAMRQVGYLESSQAVPGTTNGMHEVPIGINEFGVRTQPADLVIDGSGTVFVTDEYGDQVTALTPSGIKDKWRPTERVSLTDQPMIDRSGNLWFLEAGANLVTRIKGVAGAQRSQAPPAAPPLPGVTPTIPGGGSTSVATVDPVAAACKARQWSFGTKAAPRVLLLGNTAAQVTKCVGKPTSKKGLVWTYAKRLRVTFKAGRVTSFEVIGAGFRSKVGGIGVGSPLTALAKLSTAKVTKDASGTRYTTVLRIGSKRGAQVRFTISGKKVAKITVTAVRTAK